MTTGNKDKKPDSCGERRQDERPRRRLVDLTLKPGTDRREAGEDRRKGSDLATERRDEEAKERPDQKGKD